MDEWRVLLYPMGFLSSLVFGARFIIQWLISEKAQKSVVPQIFWQLSLLGNVLLFLHSIVQMQFHVGLVQSLNAVISWRNLNLMQNKKAPASFTVVCILIGLSVFFTTGIFILVDWLSQGFGDWFQIPIAPWQNRSTSFIPFHWHLLGFGAYIMFSSRFWIQWWTIERTQTSQLPLSFWWISLVGALFSIVYFLKISDLVNLIGPLIGIVPYVRNLMLMKRRKIAGQET